MPQRPYRRTIDPKRLAQLLEQTRKPVEAPPPPEPGLFETYAPPAIRGIGMLMGLTPLRGLGASALAEATAQGVEGRFDPKEIGIAGIMGGMGGAATKSLLSSISAPVQAGLKGAAWGAAQPVVRDIVDPEYEATGSDVAMGAGIGGVAAGGLAKLLQKLQGAPPGSKPPSNLITRADGSEIAIPKVGGVPLVQKLATAVNDNKIGGYVGSPVGPAPYRAAAKAVAKAEQKAILDQEKVADKLRLAQEAKDFEQQKLDTIIAAREGEARKSFGETLSAKTPEGATARMTTKWVTEDPDEKQKLVQAWIDAGQSETSAVQLAELGRTPKTFRPISDEVIPGSASTISTGQGGPRLNRPRQEIVDTPSTIPQATPPVPTVTPEDPSTALLRFFKGPADALGDPKFGYPAVQAAEKAGQIPKNSPFFELDSRGRPITSARMQGAALRKFGDASPTPIARPAPAEPPPMSRWGDEERALTPGLEDIPTRPISPDAVIPGADEATKKNFLDYLRERGSGEKGAINPELLARLGLGAGGALVGGATDPLDNPALSAVAGGAAGFSAPSLMKLAATASTRLSADPTVPDSIKRVIQPLAEGNEAKTVTNFWNEIPHYMRAGMLTSPNMPNNFFVGPWGSGMAAGLELKMAGDPRGALILEQMSPINWMSRYKTSIGKAEAIMKDSETIARERIEGVPTADWARMPGLFMLAGDITTRDILEAAGLTEQLARRYTLTSEPVTPLIKSLINIQRSAGMAGQIVLPFARTIGNIVEQSAARTPILGRYIQKAYPDLAYPEAVQAQQQILGSAIPIAAGAIGYMSPEEQTVGSTIGARTLRSAVSNIGGPYAGLAAMGFGAGKAMQNPDPKLGNVMVSAANEGFQSVPLPTMDVPISYANALRDLLNGEIPTRIPAGVPAASVFNPMLQHQRSSSVGRPARPRRPNP